MRTTLVCIIIQFLIGINSFGQFTWIEVSQPGLPLRMASKDIGYTYNQSPVGSSGLEYSLLKSTDGMLTFQPIRERSGSSGCYGADELFVMNQDTLFFAETCQGYTTILSSTDGGDNFTDTGLSGWSNCALFFLEPDNGFISFQPSLNSSWFVSTSSFGNEVPNYTLENTDGFEPYTEFHFFDDTTGIMVCRKGSEGAILNTIDRGVTWSEVTLSSEFFNDLIFINDTLGFAVGNNGLMMTTNDSGQNWSTINMATTDSLRSIDFYKDSVGYVVGTSGSMYKSYDLGLTWVPETAPSNEELVYVRVFDNEVVYVQQSDGTLFTNRGDLSALNLPGDEFGIISPNPFSQDLIIPWSEQWTDWSIHVSNSMGQNVTSKIKTLLATDKELKLDTSQLESGVFFIQIRDKSGNIVTTQKVIKY